MTQTEVEALEAAIDKEFYYRVNHTYGMMRWGLSAFKNGWEAGKTGAVYPYPKNRWNGEGVKEGIWRRGMEAYHAWKASI